MGSRQFNQKTKLIDIDGTEFEILGSVSDGLDKGNNLIVVAAAQLLDNGSTLDIEKGNTEVTIFASAARTGSAQSADQTNHNARGLLIKVKCTVVSGTNPTLDVKVQCKDGASSAYMDILDLNQITGVTEEAAYVYPGAVETVAEAEFIVQGVPIPRTYRIAYAIGGTDTPTFTFSVGVSLIV